MLYALKPWILIFHILIVMAWMAGMLYLPRLFIYHLEFEVGSHPYSVFCRMERRLLKIIMLPAIVLTFLSGGILATLTGAWSSPWFHTKLFFGLLLGACHGYFSRLAKDFQKGKKPALSKRSLLILNEIPFVLAALIVGIAILKPR